MMLFGLQMRMFVSLCLVVIASSLMGQENVSLPLAATPGVVVTPQPQNEAGKSEYTSPALGITPEPAVQLPAPLRVKPEPKVTKQLPKEAMVMPADSESRLQDKIEPEAQAIKPIDADVDPEEELAGIDTVDLDSPQGNWLFKRLWWERAEEKYEEIRSLQAHIFELRMPFFMKRTDVDRTILDPFYLHVAQDRGALEVLMSDIAEFLAQEAQEGMLNEAERDLRERLQAERETLEQLQKNIQAILGYDHELDAAVGTLMEQINRVSDYEQEAWKYFKEIGRVLDDKKAREYVLTMKHLHRNIKEIEDYITGRFTLYFDQLIATIAEHAHKITVTMDQLQEKGIDLKEQLNQVKEESRLEREEEREEMRKPKADESGFFERWILSPIGSFFGALWNGVVAVFSWPYTMLFGSSKPAPVTITRVEEVVIEEPKERS